MNELFLKPLEKAANYYLQLDPYTFSRLTALKGKALLIDVIGVGQFYCLVQCDGFRFVLFTDQAIDATVRGRPGALFRAWRAKDNAELMQNKDIEINGDMELGQTISRIFQDMNIDWEEQVAQRIGDAPARKLVNLVRRFQRFTEQMTESVQQNITEYLQEETKQLPTRLEVNDFINDVNALRHAVERLEARFYLMVD